MQRLEFPLCPVVFLDAMLRQLRIKDFAIIDALTVDFGPGLNVLTGETGAGKSIIVDALGLTLGARAQTDMIRTGKNETTVEAFFDVPAHPHLEKLGIAAEDGVILRRHLLSTGKGRAYINDTMVNVQTLVEVGRSLVDIHGQHEHQSLLSTDNQRGMLDAYGKLLDERGELEELFREVESLRRELSALRRNLVEKEQRKDLLGYQIQEIDSASLRTGEDDALTEERAILANLAKLNELTDGAYLLLYRGEGSSSEKLSQAISMLREVSRIDHGITETLALLESALPLVQDAAASLRQYSDRYDADPGRLDHVEERLDFIKRLERKYGQGIERILQHRDNAVKELGEIAFSDERLKELDGLLAGKEKGLYERADRLSAGRKAVSEKIGQAVESVLGELAMAKADFAIEIKPAPLSASGVDSVEFVFSANRGEPPKPLQRVASGGELSRVMLALKGILAEVDNIPVLIFDEVDAGIGGRTAESVGRRLKNLSKRRQVLCITHLPQIAAMADRHVMIEKVQRREGVYVTLKGLSRKEREEEIARMLSGKVTDISLRHARELLGSGAPLTKG